MAADGAPQLQLAVDDDGALLLRRAGPEGVVPLLRLAVPAGVVPLLGLAAAPDPEAPFRLAAAPGAVPPLGLADCERLLRHALAAYTAPLLGVPTADLLRLATPALYRLATAADAAHPLVLAAAPAPDREPPLGLAVAADAEPLLRPAAGADAAPILRLAMAANAPLLLHLATAADGAPLLRLAVAAYAARLLGLATDADAAHPHRRVQHVRDGHAAVFDDIPRRGPHADPPSIRSGGTAPTLSQRTTCFESEGAADAAAVSRSTPDFDALVALLMEALLDPTRAARRVPSRRLKTRRVKKTVQVTIRKLVQARPDKSKTENASLGSSNNLVRLKCILGDFVWFAVPIVVLFYPKKVEAEMQPSKLEVSLPCLELFSTKDLEKKIMMIVFVIFLTLWILAYLLASLGGGVKCTRLVGHLTMATILSVMALVDYSLYKSASACYTVLFAGHYIAMAAVIIYIWKKYVYTTDQELGQELRQEAGLLGAIRSWGRKFLGAIKEWRGRKLLHSQPAVGTESLSEPLIGANLV